MGPVVRVQSVLNGPTPKCRCRQIELRDQCHSNLSDPSRAATASCCFQCLPRKHALFLLFHSSVSLRASFEGHGQSHDLKGAPRTRKRGRTGKAPTMTVCPRSLHIWMTFPSPTEVRNDVQGCRGVVLRPVDGFSGCLRCCAVLLHCCAR